MDYERYLDRIGIDPAKGHAPDRETLERLHQAHVRTIPFETLSITGHPFDGREAEGVSLRRSALFEKIVHRERGGFCYELNGLFGWLLDTLGYTVKRLSGRVATNEEFGPPADHLTLVVSLDREFLVDVGLGVPIPRGLVPLDGTISPSSVGPDWRTVESSRPDGEYLLQYRTSETGGWQDRLLFRDAPREMSFFEATCEHHQLAPESPFTGNPIVMVGSEDGHKTLSTRNLTVTEGDEKQKLAVTTDEWDAVLEREFGVRYRPG